MIEEKDSEASENEDRKEEDVFIIMSSTGLPYETVSRMSREERQKLLDSE